MVGDLVAVKEMDKLCGDQLHIELQRYLIDQHPRGSVTQLRIARQTKRKRATVSLQVLSSAFLGVATLYQACFALSNHRCRQGWCSATRVASRSARPRMAVRNACTVSC
jgi:hypothetical protein